MENLILSPIVPDDLIERIAIRTAELLYRRKESQSDENELMTREETAELLKINIATLWRWTNRRRLKSYGIGGRVYYKRTEVLEALKSIN